MKRNFVSLVVCLAFIAVFAVPAALAPAATTAPTVTSITPNNLGNGMGNRAAPVIISGTGFLPGAKVVLMQSGVLKPKKKTGKVTLVSVDGSTINCNLNLSSAIVGLYDVVVTNKDKGTATLAAAFTVNPHPVVTKPHTPYSGNIGASFSLTLIGTNFVSGATVKLTKGSFPDIPITNVVVSADGTTLTCDLDLTNAHLGSYKGVVTNPDGGIGTFHFIGTK